MLKTLLIFSALVAFPALAQMNNSAGMNHGGMTAMSGANGDAMQGMNHGEMGGMDMSGMAGSTHDMGVGGTMNGAEGGDMMKKMQSMMGKMMMQQMMGEMMMDRMQGMDHGGMSGMSSMMSSTNTAPQGVGGSPLSEPGQSAFAAIAEVVNALKADPNTDWSKVNIDALRNHLRDMDIVTIDSTTVTTEVDGGLRFDVTGAGEVTNAIRRMATAHAGMMNGSDGWVYSTEEIAGGAAMSVIVPGADLAKLKGLGFYGIMAAGMHHQPHHWAMATGGSPHG
jgi:hypothetical protein